MRSLSRKRASILRKRKLLPRIKDLALLWLHTVMVIFCLPT
jgi:hypothetical protein